MKKSAAIILAIILLFSFLISEASAENKEPIVKVKLVNYLGNKSTIIIKPSGDYLVQDSNITLLNGKSYSIQYNSQNKLSLLDGSAILTTVDQLNVYPLSEKNTLSLDNRPYLGSFQFIPENSKYVRPINEVYMEDYLKGVVPAEMYASWNKEALKAQAVAARTYALSYNKRIVDDTINYQVYAGYNWHPNSTAAVEETKGEVLRAGTVLVSAVFSASNGGKTESNTNIWGGTALSYLPIKDDPFDAQANIKWQFTVQKKQMDPENKTWSQLNETDTSITGTIKSWMSSHGYAGKEIKIIGIPVLALHSPKSGGRVSKGDITVQFITKDQVDSNGVFIPQKLEYTSVAASQIRTMVGIDKMWSYLVSNISNTKDSITVSGLGNGHGVGLSQWGAEKRAEAGQKYADILGFYYDGAKLVNEYSERPLFVAPEMSKLTPSSEQASVDPASDADMTAPIISAVKIYVDQSAQKAIISFSVNEESNLTMYIKDSQDKKDYIFENSPINAGVFTKEIDIASLVNGKYYIGIITVDHSNNRSSALPSFDVIQTAANKPSAPGVVSIKDNIAPKITGTKTMVDNVKYKATVSFKTNDAAYITISVKESNGKTVKTLINNVYTKAGAVKQEFSTASMANGKYNFAITAVDKSNNRSSAAASFTVKKAAKTKTGKVTASRLYMRASASTRAKVILTLKKNQQVTILSTSGSWYKVKYGTKTGYVSKAYIK
ncbi:SpoIID/LytB domain-containing protein [Neobacillus mesonae]|uniref:SpoIID/LytB domain-containing protein n=1 Tax=Neobacillus mesonae TaxID=1193713 RepID=UPI002E233FAD|nr:SpoIID/LytB domain-containing protein [Neobacillus mesonae]MED4205534.1 SpoIID/LytB domain-containing protein [Neobacillus mesonae]